MDLEVKPFSALRYNYEAGLDPNLLLTQPYDKITPADQEAYYQKSPYNVIRLILGSEKDPLPANDFYERSAKYLELWKKENILLQDSKPAFYVYHQTFQYGGVQGVRKGFIGLSKLYDYAEKVIYPHERTLSGPKEDRLKLLKSTQTHFGQIFLMYEDPQQAINQLLGKAISEKNKLLTATDQYQTTHEVWKVDDAAVVTEVQNLMKSKSLVIADGHHRYESALNYSKTPNVSGSNGYVMGTFVNTSDLLILPTHRLVHSLKFYDLKMMLDKLQSFFEIKELAANGVEKIKAALKNISGKSFEFILVDRTAKVFHLKALDPQALRQVLQTEVGALKDLDVVVLHQLIFQKILEISVEAQALKTNLDYFREVEDGLEHLFDKNGQCLFLINPCTIEQTFAVAKAGGSMPQKSTDFFPKMLTGLVFYSL